MSTCRHTLSAYSHWHCQRGRFHFGAHRYNNYTGAWFPRFWKVRDLLRIQDCNRRLSRGLKGEEKPNRMSYRRALFPVAFKPIPVGSAPQEPYATAW